MLQSASVASSLTTIQPTWCFGLLPIASQIGIRLLPVVDMTDSVAGSAGRGKTSTAPGSDYRGGASNDELRIATGTTAGLGRVCDYVVVQEKGVRKDGIAGLVSVRVFDVLIQRAPPALTQSGKASEFLHLVEVGALPRG